MAKVTLGMTTIADKAVTTAGTRVPLAATTLVKHVIIQWHPSNTGNIYIGDVAVAAGQGLILSAANPVLNITVDESESDEDNVFIDLAGIYIDAATNGDKVKIACLGVTAKDYNS